MKGNCDADLVLHAVRGCYEGEFDKCVIISSDGDYACLVSFLLEKNKICSIISPSDKCSILIKRTGVKILYLDNLGFKVGKNKKALDMDRTI